MTRRMVLTLVALLCLPRLEARGAADQALAGKKLLLKARLEVLSLDRTIDLGGGPGTADDPMQVGGSLRLVAGGGSGFDLTFPLVAEGWRPISRKNPGKGWKYGPGSPVKKVLVKAGKQIKILGKGFDPGTLLVEDPTPVDVVLALGGQRYCLRFDEARRFRDGKKLLAKNGDPPTACAGEEPTTTSTVATSTSSTTSSSIATTTITTSTVSSTTSTTIATTTTTTSTSSSTTTMPAGCPGDTGAIVNGCFELPVSTSPSNGWSFANQDGSGGWRATGGNPDGYFILNEGGAAGTDPTVSQVVSGLTVGQPYRLTGDYRGIYTSFGDPGKQDAFAVRVEPQPSDHASTVVLALPRPAPDPDAWTAFQVDFTPTASDVTITFEAERNGDDSSFAIDNIALLPAP